VPVNTAPIATDDSTDATAGESKFIDVLSNDSDPDGDLISLDGAGTAANGTVEIIGGQVQYSANAGFEGTDSFTYTISDGDLTDTATVTVDVTAPDSEPVKLTQRGQFEDAATGTGEVEVDLGTEGVRIAAVNRNSLLGQEIGIDALPAYTVIEEGATADFGGSTVKANYWSLEMNRATRNGDPLSETALETTLEFGSVAYNVMSISGTEADDRLLGRGMDDHFLGLGGDDRLYSGNGSDILDGGAGNDRLKGGKGDDDITGGAGADQFIYNEGHGMDTIRDATAEDQFDLYDLDAGVVADALISATEVDGNTIVDFGGGDGLILEGVTGADFDALTFNF
jgi:Ca2+-binding RTX toxin-like protein